MAENSEKRQAKSKMMSNVLFVWPTGQTQRYSVYNYVKEMKAAKIQEILALSINYQTNCLLWFYQLIN